MAEHEMNLVKSNVKYETAFGTVELDFDTVKNYLVKGDGEVSDKEVYLFIMMCQAQRLNPLVTGEVHLIKFGKQTAQMVVGYDTYKRRADDNPNHLFFESGIVVVRTQTGEIVQKAGACLYPSEQLIGGWCRVHKMRGEREVTTFKEVGISEYNKGTAVWKDKPCTMIEKVAISQCLREAYPKDYEGMYTPEELAPAEYSQIYVKDEKDENVIDATATVDEPITQDDRQRMFSIAFDALGHDDGCKLIKELIVEEGLQSTAGMKQSVYTRIMKKIDAQITSRAEESAD